MLFGSGDRFKDPKDSMVRRGAAVSKIQDPKDTTTEVRFKDPENSTRVITPKTVAASLFHGSV